MVGVGHGIYWLSWIVVGVIFSFLATVVLLAMGYLCQFDVFWNVPLL